MPRQSIGSGVIIDAAQGLVVTNHHVVQGADSIVVTLSDRREFNAMLVGSDAGTDVALLRVMAEDAAFAEIPIGDSSALAVGDYVVAIGNPFGLGQTATAGIVSATGAAASTSRATRTSSRPMPRSIPATPAARSSTSHGRLLGVNTAILSGTGGNIGIGFAIPSNMAREVVEQLLEHGNVQRGRIGIAIQDVTPGLAQALELSTDRGALVTQKEPGSPAEQAGIQAGRCHRRDQRQTDRQLRRPAQRDRPGRAGDSVQVARYATTSAALSARLAPGTGAAPRRARR